MASEVRMDETGVPISALEWAEHRWRPQRAEIFSNAEVRRQTGPYASAVPVSIAEWQPQLPAALVADLDEASRALQALDLHARSALGSGGAALAPMSSVLLRTESASSSQIEQLTVSARQLALAEIGAGDRANAGLVLGNVRAMERALELADRLDERSVLEMHAELLRVQPGLEHEAGRFRSELVWIGGRDTAGPLGAQYIAPQPELVAAAIDDVLRFAARVDVPALVLVAVAHAQFETIHPFVDGNGRTGRALAQAMLRASGLTAHVTVPVSAGLLADTATYFDALIAFRAGDAGPIIRRFAAAARFAAVTGRDLVDALVVQLEQSRERMRGLRPQASAWRVLPHLLGQPVVDTRFLRERLGLNPVAAQRAIDALVEREVLVERTGASRNRVWQHGGILEVLDDYAAGLRRRS
jgi:Fic family protein